MSSGGHPRSRKGKEIATASQKRPSSEGRKVKDVKGGSKTRTELVTMTPKKIRAGWIVANVEDVASTLTGIGSGSVTAIRSFLEATKRLQLQDLNEAHFYMKQVLDKASDLTQLLAVTMHLVSYTTHLVIQFGGEWPVVSDARLACVNLTTLAGRLEIVSDIASKYEYAAGQRILIIWSRAKHVREKVIALLRERFTEVATMTRNIDLKAVADAVNRNFDGHYSDEYFCILDNQNKTTIGLVTMTPRKRRACWIVENEEDVASSVIGIRSRSIKAIRSLLHATNGRHQLQDLNEAHST